MIPKELEKRAGFFKISDKSMEQISEAVRKEVFGKLLITRAEYLVLEGAYAYWGYHPEFEELDQGVAPPQYVTDVYVDEERDEVDVSFRKLDYGDGIVR